MTVRAAQDADAVNDAASITHAVVAASSADEFDDATIAGGDGDRHRQRRRGERVRNHADGLPRRQRNLHREAGRPAASDVVITVTRSGDVTPSPATLTFTTADWNTAQTVTVRAAQDDDAVDDADSVTHSVVADSSADEYDGATIAAVSVAVIDDDDATLVVPGDPITISEGIISGGYTVRLSAQPTSNVWCA